jgi:hypothetical protein
MMRTLLAGSLLFLLLPTGAAAAVTCETEWQLLDRVDPPESGHLLYKCRPAGSDFDAYRLEAVMDAPPAAVAAAARAQMADPTSAPDRAEKTVLRDEGDEVVVHTYARLPLVSDRDVITRARQSFDAEQGTHRLEWHATDKEGPPPKEGVVRVHSSSGSWMFTPLDGGRTRAIYESHNDLAGSVPAWLINSLMTDAVVDNLARLRARVERDRKRQGD